MKKNWLLKSLSLVLAGTMMLGIVGCGNTDDNKSSESSVQESSEVKKSEESVASSTSEEEVFEVSYPLDTDVTFEYCTAGGMKYHADFGNFVDSPWHQGLEERTGVKVEWSHPGEGDTYTNLDLLLAEEKDRPDTFSRGWTPESTLNGWIVDEVIVDLTDYLPTYAPDFWEFINRPENEITKRSLSDSDGRFWFIPGIAEKIEDITYQGPIIRQDWLDECGLNMPVTMDDLEAVLIAFKDKYGATMAATYNYFKSYGFASGTDAMASFIGRFYLDDAGKVQCANVQPEWKAYLEYLAKWYDMGLIDEDIFTADNALVRQKALNGETGVSFTAQSQMTAFINDAESNSTGAEWVAMGYPRTAVGAPTSIIHSSASLYSNNHQSFITTSCDEELIPVILQWFNYPFTDEGSMYFNFGAEGEVYTLDANGGPQWTTLVTEDPLGSSNALKKYTVFTNTAFGYQRHDLKMLMNLPVVSDAVNIWTDNTEASKHFVPTLSLTEDESLVYTDKWNACSTFIEKKALEFVTGETSLDEFDAFVTELNKLGLEEAVAIQQAAYDRFMSK